MDVAPHDEAVALSPAWLSAVLGAEVTGSTVTERLETVATKVRFHVDYAGAVDGAPPDLCVKAYFNPATHVRMQAGQPEARFYRELAPALPVRTPPCVHAAIDESTGHGLVLMHDLKAAGATFHDPLTRYGAEQAAATLDQLALLHASTWERPSPSFPARLAFLVDVLDTDTLQAQLDDGRCPDVPAATRDASRLKDAVRGLADVAAKGPQCLVHGDVHTGNIYELADGSVGVIDWQVIQTGSWALDVAYHVAAVLDPDDRARSERELVDHYLDRLGASGVIPPDREDAWWLYRAHLPYGYYMWGITRFVDRPIVEQLTHRLGQAVADHDSFDLLGV